MSRVARASLARPPDPVVLLVLAGAAAFLVVACGEAEWRTDFASPDSQSR